MNLPLSNNRELIFTAPDHAKPDLIGFLASIRPRVRAQLGDLLQCCRHDPTLFERMTSEPENFPTWAEFTEQLSGIESKYSITLSIKVI